MFANIKNIISSIGAIRGLLSLIAPITDLVHQVETTGISGADKKAAALSLIQSTILTVESAFSIALPDSLILGFAGNIIDVIVAVENMLGRLKHSGTPETATVATVTAGGTPIVAKAAAAGAKVAPAIPIFAPVAPPSIITSNF